MSVLTLQQVLQDVFGHSTFRGNQEAVIRRVLAGHSDAGGGGGAGGAGGHCLVLAPTGGGKSLCYQVPALVMAGAIPGTIPGAMAGTIPGAGATPGAGELPGVTVVISPLIALMKDQVDALRARGVAATYINSSLGRAERERRYAGVAAGEFRLVYVTPERFRKPEFREALSRVTVPLLAVDEAHCVSEWGHDFRPDYTRVDEFRELLGHPTTIALTATATPEVQRDIIAQLGLSPEDVQIFHEGIDRPNLSLDVVHVVDDDQKLEHIMQQLQSPQTAARGLPCGIVYFTLIKTLREFSERLRDRRIPHLNYHGGLSPDQRRAVQDDFMAPASGGSGSCPLVLATNAFGMGIDKADIRFVIHAEAPGSLEAYYQEIGRAGRDGLPSRCTLLYDQRDLATQMEFLRWANPDAEFYQRVFGLLETESDRIHAQGLDWLRTTLHAKQGRHDRRLDTALGMLERYGSLASDSDWREDDHPRLRLVGDLAPELLDADRLEEKLRRDQRKLYALVQYANDGGDRQAFLNDYFGVGSSKTRRAPDGSAGGGRGGR